MAEKRHVQHLRSKVVENGKPKLPSAGSLYFGEIAVNYSKDVETLSIKNESGNVVTFSSDNYYTEQKLGSGFTGANSAKTVTEGLDSKVDSSELDGKIAEAIAENPSVSGAVEDIVNGKLESYSSATEINTALEGKADAEHTHAISGVTGLQDALDGKASSSHTHTASEVTDFASSVEGVVVSAITNNSDVQESIASVISASSEVSEAVKSIIPTDLSAFTNSPNYVKESEVNDLVASAITASSVVIDAITDIISSDSGITEVINGVVSGQVESAVSGKADTSAVTEAIEAATSGKVDTSTFETYTGTTVPSLLTEKASADSAITSADYDSNGKTIVFKNAAGTQVDSIDATAFIKDGMVDNVEVKEVTISGSQVTCLAITFNSDSGKEEIDIPISELFDATNYYDKEDINSLVGSGFSNSSITDVILSDELVISNSLNDLNTRLLGKADTEHTHAISGVTGLQDALDGKANTATTLGGYGITDAKIENGTITLGSNTITPLTSYTVTSADVTTALGYTPLATAVTSVTTSSTNGNISVNGSDVAVHGLGGAAYLNTGTTAGTVATGNHTHTSGDITDFASAVESVIASDATIQGISGDAASAKAVTDFYSGHNLVSTLDNVPISKRLVIASISANTNNFTLSSSALTDGYDVHIIVNNTNSGDGSITVTLPTNTNPYKVVGDSIITIADGSYGEINVISDGTTLYVRGA